MSTHLPLGSYCSLIVQLFHECFVFTNWMDNPASQWLLCFYWMNKYMAFLLCNCILDELELLISDGRWCGSCHRSVDDDRIRAEVREHLDVPVDGAVGTGLASIPCQFAPRWGLLPSSACRTAVLVAQRVVGSQRYLWASQSYSLLHICFKLWAMCEKWSQYCSLYSGSVPQSSCKQVQSYQAFYIFCII